MNTFPQTFLCKKMSTDEAVAGKIIVHRWHAQRTPEVTRQTLVRMEHGDYGRLKMHQKWQEAAITAPTVDSYLIPVISRKAAIMGKPPLFSTCAAITASVNKHITSLLNHSNGAELCLQLQQSRAVSL